MGYFRPPPPPQTMGYFRNILPIRTRLEGGQAVCFSDLITRVRTACLEAYEHGMIPLTRVGQHTHG